MNRRDFLNKTAGYAAGLSLISIPGLSAGSRQTEAKQPGEELFKELEAKAQAYMMKLGTCSQASFAALNEQFGLKGDQSIPALMPFAGGLAGNGETCGAVSGSLLALGFFLASIKEEGMHPYMLSVQYGNEFFSRFTKEFGSTRCREVVKHQFGRYFDLHNPEDQKIFATEAQQSGKCLDVVKKAVRIAGSIIQEVQLNKKTS